MTGRIRIGLLFGNKLVREGRRMLLQSQPDFDIVWEGSDGLAAVDELTNAVLDVVLIDNRLSTLSGIETIRRFLRRSDSNDSSVPVFVLTGPFRSGQMAIEAIRCGAVDLVTEEDSAEKIVEAMRAATNPHRQVDFAGMQAFFEEQGIAQGSNTRWLLRLSDVTMQEQAVLDALSLGVPYERLAQETNISSETIEEIFDSLQGRWNFFSRSQLALALHESGLLAAKEVD